MSLAFPQKNVTLMMTIANIFTVPMRYKTWPPKGLQHSSEPETKHLKLRPLYIASALEASAFLVFKVQKLVC